MWCVVLPFELHDSREDRLEFAFVFDASKGACGPLPSNSKLLCYNESSDAMQVMRCYNQLVQLKGKATAYIQL